MISSVFDALSLRERLLTILASISVVGMLYVTVFYEPLMVRSERVAVETELEVLEDNAETAAPVYVAEAFLSAPRALTAMQQLFDAPAFSAISSIEYLGSTESTFFVNPDDQAYEHRLRLSLPALTIEQLAEIETFLTMHEHWLAHRWLWQSDMGFNTGQLVLTLTLINAESEWLAPDSGGEI